MATSRDILRLTAFSSDPAGGNPAGVLLDARGLNDDELQSVAAEVGYAETAFLIEPELGGSPRHSRIRYFSPISEVPFCGHATIATAVALTERNGAGTFTFETPIGPVTIDTAVDSNGAPTATFTSVEPSVTSIDHAVLTALLGLISLDSSALDGRYPAMLSYAGNTHPIVVLQEQAAFDEFTFDPSAMRTLMDTQGWAGTVTILHPLDDSTFEARNLFPVGAITEDPATGSAAASTGGYLRELDPAATPRRITIVQGRHVGRPSVLEVDIPAGGGIAVTGTAVPITDPR
ncbi:PhzF family phenazine biosynthesis isomerase [Rhodococcus erythropolis]|uniref:PhzF family phenazine biosynthesis protein n=1 Tax=Rhodococcus erythropolis TaxID=1833 RepID=UPI002948DCB3|nr:PhzF family phenazine biosynthesis isomerase [Rhodococcus erythropolis]MDV6275960.1 PhzF family phenazine biosynthesis isomerase [Rhodococcus erythropolis]